MMDSNNLTKIPIGGYSKSMLKPKTNLDKVINFVCCLLIALALSDGIFNNKWSESIPTIVVAIVLMPGIMEWNFAKANKSQRLIMLAIAILNITFIGYLIYKRFFLKA